MSDAGALRASLATQTRRGAGMTLAGALFWAAMAVVTAFAGLSAEALATFLVVGTACVYPLGYFLNRRFGGDLLARGHPLGGMVRLLGAGQVLAWPLLAFLCVDARALLPFAIAAMLGAHFLPYGWLYRCTPAYYTLGVASVLVAAVLQWRWPMQAPLAIPLAMAVAYVVAVAAVLRENRRDPAC